MTMGRNAGRLCAVAISLGFCVAAEAGFLSKLNVFKNWSSKNRVDALIVSGNYDKPRLLAELVQLETKQPMMLLSPTTHGTMELYFMPSGPEAAKIEEHQFVEFVDFLQPKRVIFLGDEAYLPTRYVDLLKDRYPTVIVASRNWLKNAEALALLFDCKKMPRRYAEYLAKLEEASSGRPTPAGGLAAPGGALEPQAAPRTVVPE